MSNILYGIQESEIKVLPVVTDNRLNFFLFVAIFAHFYCRFLQFLCNICPFHFHFRSSVLKLHHVYIPIPMGFP